MKVSEIKNYAPKADVYELDPKLKYIVVVPHTTPSVLNILHEQLKAEGIQAVVLGGVDLRIFGLEGGQ